MAKYEELKQQFVDPPSEFSPFPFWFWNDELSGEEIRRQIHDFHTKEISGIVIHPRMGLPRETAYLSDSYMALVKLAVEEAAQLGMSVILYDEGMYPSGSACGLVVKQNPEYASRGLKMKQIPCERGAQTQVIPFMLEPGEELVSVQAVRIGSNQEIVAEHPILLAYDHTSRTIEFTPPDDEQWAMLIFVDTYSRGTIRGVHSGQDDGEPDAPLAADLLNPDAVRTFIQLTHEKYYEWLGTHFGTTIIAMFTDEPDLLGRGHQEGLKPWTNGLLQEFIASGCKEEDLPSLWVENSEEALSIRERYNSLIRNRLAKTYYKQLADWCEAHHIQLTGHPAASDDIGLLAHFHIPGQDVVWRYVAPEDEKAVTGVHSTMGKCASDSARHRGKRRNLNECFGVCGKDGGWSLTADDMKWILDWLFVRGVNLIVPHAFYYSIREERRDERPPDVGPHNIWWPEYHQFARYIKRMSWLMTDSSNLAEIAVITGPDTIPWQLVKPLYEQQMEFNYLEEELLLSSCECVNGRLNIAGYSYRAVLIKDGTEISLEGWKRLEAFIRQGGLVIELTEQGAPIVEIGQIYITQMSEIVEMLEKHLNRPYSIEPAMPSIRISQVTKLGMIFYVIVNEGELPFVGHLQTIHQGHTEYWLPWAGQFRAVEIVPTQLGQCIPLTVQRRECLVIAIDPNTAQVHQHPSHVQPADEKTPVIIQDLSSNWIIKYTANDTAIRYELHELSSWTTWSGMEHYSGTVTYEKNFFLDQLTDWNQLVLDLGDSHELVHLRVNDQEVGTCMWSPYRYEVGQHVKQGENMLRISVTNSLANRYDGNSLASGLLGPVQLIAYM